MGPAHYAGSTTATTPTRTPLLFQRLFGLLELRYAQRAFVAELLKDAPVPARIFDRATPGSIWPAPATQTGSWRIIHPTPKFANGEGALAPLAWRAEIRVPE